jgi:HD-GYP domain-containing protein (c-di-GMP phosphodiesterase class II)
MRLKSKAEIGSLAILKQGCSMDINKVFHRLSRLSDITMAISSGMELKDFLRALLKAVREASGADEAYIMLLDRDSYELNLFSVSGAKRKRPQRIKCEDRRVVLSSTEEFGFAPYIASSNAEDEVRLAGESLMLFNVFTSKQRLIYPGAQFDLAFSGSSHKNAMVIPLQTNTQSVGLLVVGNLKNKPVFTVNELEEATIFANLAAMHIEHHMLKEERDNRIIEMEKLNLLAKKLSSTQSIKGLVGLCFDYLSQILPHELGAISIYEKDRELRYFVSTQQLGNGTKKILGAHMDSISEEIAIKKPLKVVNKELYLENKEQKDLVNIFKKKPLSFLTVPLALRDKKIGFLNISSSKQKVFTREHLQTLSTLANLVSTALENIKIRIDLERRVDEVSVLFEIMQTINSTLVLSEVLDSIVNFSMEMLGALRCELRLLDERGEKLEVKASRGLSRSFLTSAAINIGEGIIGSCFTKKKPITIYDARIDPKTKHAKIAKKEGLAGLMAVPITQRGKSIGVITTYTSEPRDFSQSEVDLLSTFASQASIAIENAKLYEEMKRQYLSMVMALAAAIETKDSYTHGHSTKVMEYAVKIAEHIGLREEEVETISYAGLLHDIGKIGIKDEILTKQGQLTQAELTELRKHPEYGANIMERVEILKEIAPLTLYHHEKYDGTGYPLGLRGDQIPIGARILAVADTYDAMIADRPYRKAFPFEHVKKEMIKVSGTQLDPNLVRVFFEILKKEASQ